MNERVKCIKAHVLVPERFPLPEASSDRRLPLLLRVPRDVEGVGVGLGKVGEVLVQGDLKEGGTRGGERGEAGGSGGERGDKEQRRGKREGRRRVWECVCENVRLSHRKKSVAPHDRECNSTV